jgi:hypothetical protein
MSTLWALTFEEKYELCSYISWYIYWASGTVLMISAYQTITGFRPDRDSTAAFWCIPFPLEL